MTQFPSKTKAPSEIKEYFQQKIRQVDQWLEQLLPTTEQTPATIHEAMRYSTFAGGKRLRPILTIATGEIFGAPEQELLPVACSLEMIHTYSLIHDDLPAMDNDDLRRGMPTCHIKFGEALAILAGDALLTQAFLTLADYSTANAERKVRVLSEIAHAAATTKALIGGQVLDIQFEGKPITGPMLEEIHRAKTGALIRCAVRVGAIIGGASDDDLAALTEYGEKAGLAFQVADDLLDEIATSEKRRVKMLPVIRLRIRRCMVWLGRDRWRIACAKKPSLPPNEREKRRNCWKPLPVLLSSAGPSLMVGTPGGTVGAVRRSLTALRSIG